MISLTTRSKEAIKTGLAMAITYGIALQAGWDKPFWAGFAVAMISLSTAGQSLNKGAKLRSWARCLLQPTLHLAKRLLPTRLYRYRSVKD